MATATWIFLCILALFVFAILFVYNKPEGFISFSESSASLNQVVIPQYSNQSVYKLYDSVYFDSRTGSVIELFGQTYDNKTVDTTGASLTKMVLMNRVPLKQPNSSDFQANSKVIDLSSNGLSMLDPSITGTGASLISQFQSWVYPNALDKNSLSTVNGLTPNYQVIYIPWGNDTIVHVFDTSLFVNVATYYFRQNSDPVRSVATITSWDMNSIRTRTSKDTYSAAKSSYSTLSGYDGGKVIFHVTDNVYFDPSNRYLVINSSQGMTVYNGTTDSNGPVKVYTNVQSLTGTPNSIPTLDFQALYILDPDGRNVVIYMPIPNSTKTMIAVLSSDMADNSLLSVRNVALFNPNSSNGLDGNPDAFNPTALPQSTNTPQDNTSSSTTATATTTTDSSSNTMSSPPPPNVDASALISGILQSIFKANTNSNYYMEQYNPVTGQYSQDLIPKTQIVPPVCPACPNCPANVTCSNCNKVHGSNSWQDGSGNSTNGHGIGRGGILNGVERAGNDVLGGAERAGNDVLGGAERVGGDVLGGAVLGGALALGGAKEVGEDIYGGAKQVGGDIYGGAKQVGGDIYGGAKQVGGDIANGIGRAFSLNPTMVNGANGANGVNGVNGANGVNGPVQPIANGPDTYSYYGALPNKGPSNFLPIGSDFSKFGR
jgi:hypothetical protein